MSTIWMLGVATWSAGFAQMLLGWLRYRLPGKAFWTFVPINQASRFLKPTGVKLANSGMLFMGVGAVAMVAANMLGA